MANSLALLKQKGFSPRAAIDIGSHVGHWSKSVKYLFQDIELLMVEPLPARRDQLQSLASQIGASLIFDLLSDRPGELVSFYLGDNGSSIYEPKRFNPSDTLKLRTSCLDSVVLGTPFECPDLIKLDVQGAEYRVLEGGMKALAMVEVLIIELSVVNSYSQGMLMHEMISYLADRGLFLYDIGGLLRANRTRSINEIDGIFVRGGSSLWDIQHFLPIDVPFLS